MTMTGWLADVAPQQRIRSPWGNAIRDRTITPFPTAADRNAAIPVPAAGMTVYITSLHQLQTWNGTAWVVTGTDRQPWGLIGMSQLTAPTGAFDTTPGEGLVIAGLQVVHTADGTRRVSISVHIPTIYNATVNGATVDTFLEHDANVTSPRFRLNFARQIAYSAADAVAVHIRHVWVPNGVNRYTIMARTTAGTAQFYAATTA